MEVCSSRGRAQAEAQVYARPLLRGDGRVWWILCLVLLPLRLAWLRPAPARDRSLTREEVLGELRDAPRVFVALPLKRKENEHGTVSCLQPACFGHGTLQTVSDLIRLCKGSPPCVRLER